MKKFLFFLTLIALLFVVAACGADSDSDAQANEAEGQSGEEADASEESAEDGEQPAEVVVEHELDTTTVPVNPEKVVVFDYGTLETLDELGVEVAGVPQGNLPPHLEKFEGEEYTNVGSLKEPDFEALAVLDPDLIIISGRQSEVYEDLAELAPTIYMGVDTANYLESFQVNVETLGEIFAKEDEAAEKLDEVLAIVDEVKATTDSSDGKGLIILTNDGGISAYGAGSRFGYIHDELGVAQADDNIEVATHGQNVSFEYISETNPDYLFVVDRNTIVGGEESAQKTLDNDLVQGTNAAQNDKIIYLDPYFWYVSGGGLVSVKEMATEVKEAIQ
ncbi:ABC transporter substrate-binding protein [Gracilibacillus salitolerans]|uniref:ABC transporter substrate-binding protein n=1 Tax=Gracilibacillus salitolerans TaxID=2663022 RepID=A0A5Q2TJ80_9BACI|nr:siderophore ABC transporter substrate-binding protein [Gracilibacillus salitolerans]QGH34181.1 ABC transporter substrate-binding protein [Gracilibacillus salitolerans]